MAYGDGLPGSGMRNRGEMAWRFRGAILAAGFLGAGLSPSSVTAQTMPSTADGATVIRVDWQGPEALAPRFRNHCGIDRFGRAFCSNHCGLDHQFYYCSEISFGCCHFGRGYCSFRGQLRCAP